MSFVAVAIGGSALIGAGAAIVSGNKAAGAQRDATNQATALERDRMAEASRQYDISREDLAPYRTAGYTALGQIGQGTISGGEFNRDFTTADFNADPGYEFRRSEGQRGIEASASARGRVLSGGTLKALSRFNSGLASQEYSAAYDRFRASTSDRFNRLASVAGIGQQATNAGISASQANTAQQMAGTQAIAGNIAAAGNARASQYVNTGNAIGGAVGQIGQYFALRDLYKTPAAFIPETAASYGG